MRGQLFDVSAISAADAWAVGMNGSGLTLVEHWNGSVWRRVASPDPGRRSNSLSAVAAIAPDNVWAAGSFGLAHPAALVLHWDGSGWHRTRLPYAARHANIADIAAMSANDVWAVGATSNFTRSRTLHYDGATWRLVPSVSSAEAGLSSVAGTAPTDVWAVGRSLIEHWDGHTWNRVVSPGAGQHRSLRGVTAISPTDAFVLDGGRGAIDHWDGSSWTTAATATAGIDAGLLAIAASGPTDAWMVGSDSSGQPTVDYWDGATLVERSIHTAPAISSLASVANVPTTTSYWAVGFTGHDEPSGFSYATPRIDRCG